MRFSRAIVGSFLVARTSAFAPRAFAYPRRALSSLNANVLKLSDPEKELLDKVDVFIFDCDGVIWRVCATKNFLFVSLLVLFSHSSFLCPVGRFFD